MIKVGTICMLTGDHSRAGQCCTVTSPLQRFGRKCRHLATGTVLPDIPRYAIKLANRDGRGEWVALPRQLIPIAPPGLTEGEDTRQPVREVA